MRKCGFLLILTLALTGCTMRTIRTAFEESEQFELVLYTGGLSTIISDDESKLVEETLPEAYTQILKDTAAIIEAGMYSRKPTQIHANAAGRIPAFQQRPYDGIAGFVDLLGNVANANIAGVGMVPTMSIVKAHKGRFKGMLVGLLQAYAVHVPEMGGIVAVVRFSLYDREKGAIVLDRALGQQLIEADPDAPYARLTDPLPLKALTAGIKVSADKLLTRMRKQP